MKDIETLELKNKIQNNEKLNIIDVREQWEFDEFNVGGKLMPLPEIPNNMEALKNQVDDEIILVCQSGNRSGQAKMYLESQGFKKLRNLLGGLIKYKSEL